MSESAKLQEAVWTGRPYQGLFVRPTQWIDLVSTTLGGLVISGLCLLLSAVLMGAIIAILTVAMTLGALAYDAHLRRDLRYTLSQKGLVISKHSNPSANQFIPAAHLDSTRLVWSARISSIELPGPFKVTRLLNKWFIAIPTLDFGARLELLEKPEEILALLHGIAKTASGSPSAPMVQI